MPALEGVEHRWVEARGLRFHLAEAGAGEPVLLLHGWPQHWWGWRHVIPLLAERRRVICADLRGFGWSDAPPDGYEKETMADDVAALLDELALERVDLVGHDWGGWIGFLLCLRERPRVRRFLALNIAPPMQRPSARSALAFWRFWYQVVVASPWLGEWLHRSRPAFVRAIITAGAVHRDAWTDADLDLFAESLREPARARAATLLYRTFLTRELPATPRQARRRLEVPTRLLFGTRDLAISRALVEGPFDAADFEIELRDDSGHFIAEELPEVVAERAIEFFGAAG